jgi:alkanesulfonate monooxygenase SsuD/methylene tetrahydromethanopterin reductase-like flavin-dependent oxidoreductase (luciferase family)
VAREAASLDLLSDGRARFGAGLGSAPDQEFAAFGEDPDPLVRAARLDEALEIVDRLWSGQPVEYHGEHHLVDGARFLPRPIQRPRIPVWIAGRWPASAPFRRAARWDGVFPTHRDVGHAETMTPEQLTEIVSFTLRYRDSAGSFDVVIEGQTAGEDPAAELERVRAYEKAGLTWWVEKLGWFRGSIDYVRARIAAGPPR